MVLIFPNSPASPTTGIELPAAIANSVLLPEVPVGCMREKKRRGRIKITYTMVLDEHWASDEEVEQMCDAEILELVQEDVIDFLDGGVWSVKRTQ